MKLQIQIDDDLYDGLVARSSEVKARLLVQQIVEHFAACTPVDRYLVLDQETVRALEDILKGGQLRTGRDLLDKVRRLASIEIGHIRLNPSPAQMEELALRAAKFGRTPQQEAEIVFRQLSRSFFNREPEPLPTL